MNYVWLLDRCLTRRLFRLHSRSDRSEQANILAFSRHAWVINHRKITSYVNEWWNANSFNVAPIKHKLLSDTAINVRKLSNTGINMILRCDSCRAHYYHATSIIILLSILNYQYSCSSNYDRKCNLEIIYLKFALANNCIFN